MPPYLWQHTDWTTQLRWHVDRVLPVLSTARRAQGHLLGRVEALGVNLGAKVHAESVALNALTTAAVEGVRLDPEGVRSSVARRLGLPSAGRVKPSRQIDGLVELLLDATDTADTVLTEARLHGWHAGLFPTGYTGMHPLTVAGWRTGPEPMRVVSGGLDVQIVHYEAPPSEQVPTEMARFLQWWNQDNDDDGLIRAATAHLRFITIHPYDDGNGRIARAITDRALAADEGTSTRLYSMSAQIEANRAAYYHALQQAQRGDGEITEWILWFLNTLIQAFKATDSRLDVVVACAEFWRTHGGVAINERQSEVIRRLLDFGPEGFKGGLSTRKYVALTRVSRATAQRELLDLLQKGLLERLPGGGRSTAYALRW